MTVLGAKAALRIQQEMQPNSIAVVMAANAIRGGELVEESVVGSAEHGESVSPADDLTSQRVIRESVPIGKCVHDTRILKQ